MIEITFPTIDASELTPEQRQALVNEAESLVSVGPEEQTRDQLLISAWLRKTWLDAWQKSPPQNALQRLERQSDETEYYELLVAYFGVLRESSALMEAWLDAKVP